MLGKGLGDLFQRAIFRNRRDPSAWHHRFADDCVGEFEDAVDQAPLFSAQMTLLARNVNQLPQLRLSIDRCMFETRFEADQSAQGRAGFVEDPEQRTEAARKKFEWPGTK